LIGVDAISARSARIAPEAGELILEAALKA